MRRCLFPPEVSATQPFNLDIAIWLSGLREFGPTFYATPEVIVSFFSPASPSLVHFFPLFNPFFLAG